MAYRKRTFVLSLGLLALGLSILGAGMRVRDRTRPASESSVVNDPSLSPTAPATAPAQSGSLVWFNTLIAHGQTDQAVRAALVRLRAEGPLAPGVSVARDQLLARLRALLPSLAADVAQEVLIALVKQPQSAAEAGAVLAHLTLIQNPSLRIHALRRLLDQEVPVADLVPLLATADPRIRAAAAAALRRQLPAAVAATDQAATDQAAATQALAAAEKNEADPRVRQALTAPLTTEPVVFPEDRRNPVLLPLAVQRVPAKIIESAWDPGTNDKGQTDYRSHSTITINDNGMAHVETESKQWGSKWHVSYDGWAWKDASGNIVIDARGQPVQYLDASDNQRGWSPDSMTISPDGTTTTIDDRHQSEPGQSGLPGAG